MKKFLISLMAVCFCLTFASCGVQFGLAYGVQLSGDGDGCFEVTFPQGSYAMDGKAALVLNIGDTVLLGKDTVTTKSAILLRGNKKEMEAMQRVNDSIATRFNASAGEGTYGLWIKGFVKEIGTGLIFEVDRHITNRDLMLRTASGDFCPYIK